MIPANTFTVTPQVSTFAYGGDAVYTPLSQTVMGGINLNDPSLGRLVKQWTGFYDNGQLHVKPSDGAIAFSMNATDVQTVSLAFDNNMSIVLAWKTSDGIRLYYFDTLTSDYTTRFFSGYTGCRVAVDDPRDFYTSTSDVILSYTNAGNLCYRQQRDRYDVEYVIGTTTRVLTKMGPNVGNRLQFELR